MAVGSPGQLGSIPQTQTPVLIAAPPQSKGQISYATRCALGLGATQVTVGIFMIGFHVSVSTIIHNYKGKHPNFYFLNEQPFHKISTSFCGTIHIII